MRRQLILSMLMMFTIASAFATSRVYDLKITLSDGEGSSSYSYHQFPAKQFVNDTIAYGDTVTFNLYVDFNKHAPVSPMLYVLLSKAGTTDSLKVARTIFYSQFSAIASDNLGAMQPNYIKTFRSRASTIAFNAAAYYPLLVADSITSAGLAYPSFSLARSVKYTVTVIPLKAGTAVKVKDIRFKLYLQPAQFK